MSRCGRLLLHLLLLHSAAKNGVDIFAFVSSSSTLGRRNAPMTKFTHDIKRVSSSRSGRSFDTSVAMLSIHKALCSHSGSHEISRSATKDSLSSHNRFSTVRYDSQNGRRSAVWTIMTTLCITLLPSSPAVAAAPPKKKRCTDIESCREIGDKKIEVEQKTNPTTVLPSGVRYKVLKAASPGGGDDVVVRDGTSLDLIYSISEGGGAYMYSQGFGFEKVDVVGTLTSDLGLDELRVVVGSKDVPLGIEHALSGMRKGERRRVELPPNVGFDTSDWRPEPVSRRGKASIANYRRTLTGFGAQPPFPAVTIWDVEVVKIRS